MAASLPGASLCLSPCSPDSVNSAPPCWIVNHPQVTLIQVALVPPVPHDSCEVRTLCSRKRVFLPDSVPTVNNMDTVLWALELLAAS